MNVTDLKYTISMIKGYSHAREEECYPERWCLIQAMIYAGDYSLRCNECKFNCSWGPRHTDKGCCRPWYCNT